MIDTFVLLTPLILLPMIFLLVFVGCTLPTSGTGPPLIPFGDQPGDIPVPGYYDDSDGNMQAAYYRPADHSWHIWQGNLFEGEGSELHTFTFGQDGDIPVPGNYDFDDITGEIVITSYDTPVLYRPVDSTWHFYDLANGQENPARQFAFGTPWPSAALQSFDVSAYLGSGTRTVLPGVDTPLPGPFLMLGGPRALVAVVHNNTIHFGEAAGLESVPPQTITAQNGEFLVPALYNNGVASVALLSPQTGQWRVYAASGTLQDNFSVPYASGNIPLTPHLYSGDTSPKVVLFDPSSGNWNGFIPPNNTDSNPQPVAVNGTEIFGGSTGLDVPVPGDYDGNGTLPTLFNSGEWSRAPYNVEGSNL